MLFKENLYELVFALNLNDHKNLVHREKKKKKERDQVTLACLAPDESITIGKQS